MPPIPPERFASLFRGLDDDERVAFVAALWTERGWETTTEGDTVVARHDGETERVRVVDPGRLGTPALADADVLVSARDRDAVRAGAAEAGVRYLAPADVRELLLYGLERPAAAALFEQTFGRPLEPAHEPGPSFGQRVRTVGSELPEAVTTRLGSRRLAVLVVLGLLVGAAVGAPGLVSQRDDAAVVVPVASVTPGDVGAVGEQTATATPTETSGASADGRPAGLGERTLVDPVALANGHVEAVTSEARTLRVQARGPPEAAFMKGRTAWNYTARIEAPRHYRFDGHYRFPRENGSENWTVGISLYTQGDTKYRQVRRGNETSYQRYATATTGDASGYATEVREYLVLLLDGDRSTVECVATLTGGECFAYRVVVTGAPPLLSEEAADYRAVAVVQDDGVVASLAVNYTLPVGGERVPTTFRFEYDDVGDTTVTPPEWLPAAKNETDD